MSWRPFGKSNKSMLYLFGAVVGFALSYAWTGPSSPTTIPYGLFWAFVGYIVARNWLFK